MSNKNNSPEQKAEWSAMRGSGRLPSKHVKVTPATQYNPVPKAPSARDKHRAEVAART